MQNILRNFFTLPPVKLPKFKQGIRIDRQRLEQISPGLVNQLVQSSNSYIEGLIDMDEQFIKNTTSPYLFGKIQSEIRRLRNDSKSGPQYKLARELEVDTSKQSSNQLAKYPVKIYPYVVFGRNVSQRITQPPDSKIIQVTRNRYIDSNFPSNISKIISAFTQSISQQLHTHGFRCEFITDQKMGRSLVVTFQGLIGKEYFVVDLNNQLMAPANQPS